MYWDAYKNYYANKQEGFGMVIHNEPLVLVQNVTSLENNNTGTPIPKLPLTAVVPTFYGQRIRITKTTAGPQPINQVMVEVRTLPSDPSTGTMLSLAEIGVIMEETTTYIDVEYTLTGIGATRFLMGWRYINSTDTPLTKITLNIS